MRNIGIITNNEKDVGFAYTNMLIESIRKFGGQAVIPTRSVTKGMEGLDNEVEEICSKCELII